MCIRDSHNPDYIVRRLDPFAKVKDHCDKCNQTGWDYVITERPVSYTHLHPENKKMKDIIVDECCIQGVACHIIKEL